MNVYQISAVAILVKANLVWCNLPISGYMLVAKNEGHHEEKRKLIGR